MAKAPADKASAILILQQTIDLSSKVKESCYVGFSAANGGASGSTTLYEWQFSSALADAGAPLPPDTSIQQNPPPGTRSSSNGTSKSKHSATIAGFVFLLLGFY